MRPRGPRAAEALRRAALAVLALSLGPLPAKAQPATAIDRQSLGEAERDARSARDAAAGIARAARAAEAAERGLAERRAEAGRRAVAAEAALAAAEARLAAAGAARDAAEADLTRRAEELAPLVPAMRRLSLWPAETLLVVPAPPEEALRGALVLRGVARRLAAEAADYRSAREAAARAAAGLEEQRRRLVTTRVAARETSDAVEVALNEARTRRDEARDAEAAATRRAAAAAAQARDLRGALERLEREAQAREARERAEAAAHAREAEARERQAEARRREAEGRAREAEAREAARDALARDTSRETSRDRAAQEKAAREMQDADRDAERARESLAAARERARDTGRPRPGRAAPVAGSVQRDFGERGATGQTWLASPGARVVSPCSGQVVFSGPFRSYGRMLIVDCGGGYHFVLAGLDRLDAEPGQRVLAGEAVGTLGNAVSAGGGRASLYLELRRRGQPVDPASWMRRG
ncbi:murein hydrolase activator EnvC family protein [Muricoccus aerilatus]|uniref:murein hydrolase activator EnvC family protein n=1 Tax=Muricoccus aerilatus TaxID=452982 RepID=UPI0005C21C62|nr:peptidoglycan DD-metalloendopeptidase family protein [Roseomonas aerilata]